VEGLRAASHEQRQTSTIPTGAHPGAVSRPLAAPGECKSVDTPVDSFYWAQWGEGQRSLRFPCRRLASQGYFLASATNPSQAHTYSWCMPAGLLYPLQPHHWGQSGSGGHHGLAKGLPQPLSYARCTKDHTLGNASPAGPPSNAVCCTEGNEPRLPGKGGCLSSAS